jgi:uncharacterized membrane protein
MDGREKELDDSAYYENDPNKPKVEVNFKNEEKLEQKDISSEELSIEDLHDDLEKRLQEQGFIFDKRKFIFNDEHMTFGEKVADKVAGFGGSWTFIIIFLLVIVGWMALNIIYLMNKGFDPYPFILLNLVLSCIASLQAPIIMMSQNRHSIKERKQEEINIEKEIIDFKQDRLDLILDQKQWEIIKDIHARLIRMDEKEDYRAMNKDKSMKKVISKNQNKKVNNNKVISKKSKRK